MFFKFLLSIFIFFSSVGFTQTTEEIEWEEPTDSYAIEELLPDGQNNTLLYKMIKEPIIASEKFVFRIFEELGKQIKGIFVIAVSGYLFITIVQWMWKRELQLIQTLLTLFMMIFAWQIVYHNDAFDRFVYTPIIQTTESAAGFMIVTASGGTSSYGEGALQDTLQTMQQEMAKINTINEAYLQRAEDEGRLRVVSAFKYWIKGLFVSVIYGALALVFCFLYMIGIVAIHFMLVLTPFVIVMGSIPQLRGIFKNWGKTIFTFSLMPVFASIAMGLTIFIIGDLADQAVYAAGKMAEGQKMPEGLYLMIIGTGIISIFMHLKAAEFASHLAGGPLSNFGQLAGAGIAAATGAAKAYGAAPAGRLAVSKGINPAASMASQGLKNMGGQGAQMMSAAGQAMKNKLAGR